MSLLAFRTSLHREKNGAARERPLSGRGCLKGVATVRLQDISASTRTGSTKSSSQIVGFSRSHRRSALQRFASDRLGDRELAMPGTRWPVGRRANDPGLERKGVGWGKMVSVRGTMSGGRDRK